MANMSYHIANLLEKMLSTDKDFRFMATNDLMTELQASDPISNNSSQNQINFKSIQSSSVMELQ